MKKIASLLLGFTAAFQPTSALTAKPAPASSDHWIIYDRAASDGKPLVVVARTGNTRAETLLRVGLASVVICQANPAIVNNRGMPQDTARLYPVEDKLDEEPNMLAAGAIRVASVTGQGQRRMFFVHRDPIDLPTILKTIQVEGYSCSALTVSDRHALLDLATPTPLEKNLAGDQEVIAGLQQAGDDSHFPRKADFWFYGNKTALNSLIANLKLHGFGIDHWLPDTTGVVLSRVMPVDLATFKVITPMLIDAARQADATYDGWETLVISQSSTHQSGRTDH